MRLAALAGCLLLAGCGQTAKPSAWAAPQTVRLAWHWNCGTRTHPLDVSVRRLVVRARSWSVEGGLANGTGLPLFVDHPHVTGTLFGLLSFRTTSLREVIHRAATSAIRTGPVANRFQPFFDRHLAPGARWSGTFFGPGLLPRGVVLRVRLGRFVLAPGPTPPGLFRYFLCISPQSIRLR